MAGAPAKAQLGNGIIADRFILTGLLQLHDTLKYLQEDLEMSLVNNNRHGLIQNIINLPKGILFIGWLY